MGHVSLGGVHLRVETLEAFAEFRVRVEDVACFGEGLPEPVIVWRLAAWTKAPFRREDVEAEGLGSTVEHYEGTGASSNARTDLFPGRSQGFAQSDESSEEGAGAAVAFLEIRTAEPCQKTGLACRVG